MFGVLARCSRTKWRSQQKILRTAWTRSRKKNVRRKKTLLETDDHPPRRNEVRNGCENLDLMLEAALWIMENLSEEYLHRVNRYNRKKVGKEMEQIQESFEIIINGYTAIYFGRIYDPVNLLQYRRTSLLKLELKPPR